MTRSFWLKRHPQGVPRASGYGTTRTFRDVRYLVAIRCKPDIEQGASNKLNLWVHALGALAHVAERHRGPAGCFCFGTMRVG